MSFFETFIKSVFFTHIYQNSNLKVSRKLIDRGVSRGITFCKYKTFLRLLGTIRKCLHL